MVSAGVPQKTHLLCAGLYQVRWEHVPEKTDSETSDIHSCANDGNITAELPDQIQEGVSWTDLFYGLLLSKLIFGAFSRVDDEHNYNSNKNCNEGCGHVVNHSSHAHLPRGLTVQSCHS